MAVYSNRLDMIRPLDVTTSVLTTIGRLGSGARVGTLGNDPRGPSSSTSSRRVSSVARCARRSRSSISRAIVYPCPKGGPTWRPRVRVQGGRELFPYLVDPNTGRAMYESNDIVAYLFSEYGDGRVAAALGAGVLTDASSMLSGLWRLGGGGRYRRARVPEQLIELLLVRGVAVLPDCARGALESRAGLPAAQRRAGQSAPRGVSRALGAHDGTVARRSEHGRRDVRVGGHRRVSLRAYASET